MGHQPETPERPEGAAGVRSIIRRFAAVRDFFRDLPGRAASAAHRKGSDR